MNWINLLELLGVCDAMSVGGKLGRIAVPRDGLGDVGGLGWHRQREDFVGE